MKRTNKNLIIGCIILITLSIGLYLSLALYIGINAEHDTKSKSDAILVLGARAYIDGKYNPCLKARILHAVELYKAGFGKKIIVSGGNDTEDNVNEAETMRKIAMENGIKQEDILLEKNATSTYENFSFSKKILSNNKLSTVVIVTEPFHILRASLVADKQNLQYTLSPTIGSLCWLPNKYFSKYFLKEPFAISIYKLQNKL